MHVNSFYLLDGKFFSYIRLIKREFKPMPLTLNVLAWFYNLTQYPEL